ncbi:MAG: tetratricopeptide repeat protein [Betaproteobacteria bacterium]
MPNRRPRRPTSRHSSSVSNTPPQDLDARLQLANLCASKQDYAQALEQLLEIVRRDRSFRDDIGRKTMLQVFGVLGNEDELVSEYRRRLASAMY